MMRSRIDMSWMSSKRAHMLIPALFTSVSRRPKASTAPATIACQSRSTARSPFTVIAEPPALRHCSATASSSFSLRAASTSFAPCAASCRASSAPIPFEAPVIATTLPFTSLYLGRGPGRGWGYGFSFVGLGIGNVVEGDVQPAAVARLVGAREIDRLLAETCVQLVERRVEVFRLSLRGEERDRVAGLAHEIGIGHADLEDGAPVLRAPRPELFEDVQESHRVLRVDEAHLRIPVAAVEVLESDRHARGVIARLA